MIKLEKNEKVILIKRRHTFVIILEIFLIALICLIIIGTIIFFSLFSNSQWIEKTTTFIPYSLELNIKYLILFILSLLLLIFWQFCFVIIADYYLDCWVITNKRTIHTELRGLFSRFYSTVPNDKIQDITADIEGFFPTLLKYGDLHIHTAGSFKNFIFRQIPDPFKTKDILLKVLEEKTEEIEKKVATKSEEGIDKI